MKKRHYAAFISYRHKMPDMLIANVLHFLLEYNLVRPDKSYPRFIRPVFLDTKELPLQDNLDDGIVQALDESDFLFVICSPDLPQSKYCMREISYFKEKHGGSLDNIALLLVRGEEKESIPAILKTAVDTDHPAEELHKEPLFGDVRGRNIFHSLSKLWRSEYLRLTARYYNCDYDRLYRRHLRNRITAAVLAGVTVLTLGGLFAAKEYQLQTIRANSTAAFVEEEIRKDNEFLALAFSQADEYLETPEYTGALQSAVIQLDYKLHGQPIAQIIETDYDHTQSTYYYLSATGHQLVVADGNVWKIIDAYHGGLIREFPYESAYVLGNRPSIYITIDAKPDENGVFRDYVHIFRLETNELVAEFPFREAGNEMPAYRAYTLLDTQGYLCSLRDGDEIVAWFTADGEHLTEEEAIALTQEYQAGVRGEEKLPYELVLDKREKCYKVKNQAGESVLILESYSNAAFSPDGKQLAVVNGEVLTVYDLESRQAVGEVTLEADGAQSLQFLPGSSLLAVGHRQEGNILGDVTRSVVYDWRVGDSLFATDGTILVSPTEQAFFTVLDGGITRYQYNDLDRRNSWEILAHTASRTLYAGDGSWVLLDNTTDQPIWEVLGLELRADESLCHALLRREDELVFLDRGGRELWQLSTRAKIVAISPDGSLCAFLDEGGDVRVLDGETGEERQRIPQSKLTGAGEITDLAISQVGVMVVGNGDSLWVADEAVSLGSATGAAMYSDGIVILDSDGRINDLRIYDTLEGKPLSPFAENTGEWVYSPSSGYLVRHVEATGNHASLELAVCKIQGGILTEVGRLTLPESRVGLLTLDESGKFLSVESAGHSTIYDLGSMTRMIEVQGAVYREGQEIFGKILYGNKRYHVPLETGKELLETARKLLEGPLGPRQMTKEEFAIFDVK